MFNSILKLKNALSNVRARDSLHTIVYRYPPTYSLSGEEQDLVWKHRFYLSSQEKALTKFLKCINWETGPEVKQALGLLAQWTPMNVEDALELLSPTFKHPTVRRYAISRLKQAPDEDLLLYLLQLVQALKYENTDDILEAYRKIMPEKEILKSIDDNGYDQSSDSIGTPPSDISTQSFQTGRSMSTSNVPASVVIEHSLDQQNNSQSSSVSINESDISNTLMSDNSIPFDLAGFLIHRACRNPTLANYLYWYLSIECEDQENIRKPDNQVRHMYVTVFKTYLKTLSCGSPELRMIHANLKRQQLFIDNLVKLVKMVAKESGNRKKKTEKFQQLLADSDAFKINFVNFDPIPFPLNPEIIIKGIVPGKTSLFNSALMPAK